MESFTNCHNCRSLVNVHQIQGSILYPEGFKENPTNVDAMIHLGDKPVTAAYWVKLCSRCHAGLLERGFISPSNGMSRLPEGKLFREKPIWWL